MTSPRLPGSSLPRRHPALLAMLGLACVTPSILVAQEAPSRPSSPAAADPKKTPPVVITKTASTPTGEDVVQLLPFEVSADDNRGYLATSTLSGTRLNSKIDINDVFMYEANTEGTAQWTSFAIDRGTVSAGIQMDPYGRRACAA